MLISTLSFVATGRYIPFFSFPANGRAAELVLPLDWSVLFVRPCRDLFEQNRFCITVTRATCKKAQKCPRSGRCCQNNEVDFKSYGELTMMMVTMRMAAPTAAAARLYSGGSAPPDTARYSSRVISSGSMDTLGARPGTCVTSSETLRPETQINTQNRHGCVETWRQADCAI